MQRKTFDAIVSGIGLIVAIVLLIASGLLFWAHNFVHTQVTQQLSAQQIYFPPAGSDALKPDNIGPYLNKYAGQQLTTGKQAQAYADHFIAVHLDEIAGGKTYAQLSTKALANPKDEALAAQVAVVFKGETLRGLLLNAYAFDTMATVAWYAGFAALIGGLALLILSILGIMHLRRVSPEEELGSHAS
jgi:hypothetical protein